ncbi:hypothetical protein HDV02_000545 [Globomyces sp. JEL0801]|nr:hypothetical protein HDV02_000545 [Globomyces sp. JEL0801]
MERRPTLFAPPPELGAKKSMRRAGTLSRPDRKMTLLRQNPSMFEKPKEKPSAWVLFSWAVTCCCPGPVLRSCVPSTQQQAWREKVALCFIAGFLMAATAFFLLFFNSTLCPPDMKLSVPLEVFGGVVIFGKMYKSRDMIPPYNTLFDKTDGDKDNMGTDVSQAFAPPPMPSCDRSSFSFAKIKNPCQPDNCLDLDQLRNERNLREFDGDQVYMDTARTITKNISYIPSPAYQWSDLRRLLNFDPYLRQFPDPIPGDAADALIRKAYAINDITHLMAQSSILSNDDKDCLFRKYNAGQLNNVPMGCMAAKFFTWVLTSVVLIITFTKFLGAVVFDWFVSRRISREPSPDKVRSNFNPSSVSKPILQNRDSEAATLLNGAGGVTTGNAADLYTVLLVTCYSEGEASIRGTLDSLAGTSYDDRKKLLFVIADGLVKGSGETQSTPDIIINMMEHDPRFPTDPRPQSYQAVASGSKQHNMGKVYCGYYRFEGHMVPMVLVVKCGTPQEIDSPKPGNRGKRDSQLILMRFFSRVTLRDRMSPLEYDLFRKIHHITGVTPDFYEAVLMVDADTQVDKPSLRYLVNTLQNDQAVMGLCGETRITNKTQSWVTAIQVFEYFISHQLGKAFESLFGGVTCLPGCFCMWRIKSLDEDGMTRPIVGNPDILEQYSTNEVYTLHQKNLLLLGEDRFLTTIMLKKFPIRKTVYVPKAVCRTIVPDDFKTLLSQRRRWINSTIHNLMELFLVLMDLISTAVLPMGLIATYYLIVKIAITPPNPSDTTSFLLAISMGVVLFLPAVIVLLTGRRITYVGWMMVYLLALPIWQFVLPLYSFWHFDDFSWGETRKVEGHKESKSGHDDGDGKFNESLVPLRRWEEYESNWRKSRLSVAGSGGSSAEAESLIDFNDLK